jgi:putative glycosyltransferase (TIGR04348 family)
MRIIIVTPAPPGSRRGNRITAVRWSRLLRQLGHRVAILNDYDGQHCDILIALHARRSFAAVKRFHDTYPNKPLIVALTGTDLYDDIHRDAKAQQSLAWATRLIVLQQSGVKELPKSYREKTRVIYQSTQAPRVVAPATNHDVFQVCVLGHLRPVKDPFRTTLAARLLPPSSRVRVVHVGGSLSPAMAQRASTEAATTPRYRWLGNLPRWKALRVLARSHLLVLTSVMEGGANVISEAIAVDVPVISSRIAGSIGILGAGYPGYFPVGDTEALAAMLHQAETDDAFYRRLRQWCRRLRPLVQPSRERESWRRLIRESQKASR